MSAAEPSRVAADIAGEQSAIERLAATRGINVEALIAELTPDEQVHLRYNWEAWARPSQIPPRDDAWKVWLAMTGRGWGKTRAGAEWIRWRVESGLGRRIAICGPTTADIRKYMIEGESGILAVSPPWCKPEYIPSRTCVRWPNGAVALLFTAEEPERFRGHNSDSAWCDEVAWWAGGGQAAWDNLQLGLRAGTRPQCVCTTTPSRTPLIRLLADDPEVRKVRGSTTDNARNLALGFLEHMAAKYGGTTLGEQELHGRLLRDVEGALWTLEQIDAGRVREAPADMASVVVGVDPSGAEGGKGDEAGVVVVGRAGDHFFVLADDSLNGSPDAWARAAVNAYRREKADRIVAEGNYGGEMVRTTIHSVEYSEGHEPTIAVQIVHASRGKQARAEPVHALYEQGRVHHVGVFPRLEDELTTWKPGRASPDRLDALVWAITCLQECQVAPITISIATAKRANPLATSPVSVDATIAAPVFAQWVDIA